MNMIALLLVGAAVGWLGGMALTSRGAKRRRLAVPVGMFGALLGGFFLGPIVGGGDLFSNRIDLRTLAIALAGAAALFILLAVVRRRRPVAPD